jgi:hypothetical protein
VAFHEKDKRVLVVTLRVQTTVQKKKDAIGLLALFYVHNHRLSSSLDLYQRTLD